MLEFQTNDDAGWKNRWVVHPNIPPLNTNAKPGFRVTSMKIGQIEYLCAGKKSTELESFRLILEFC